MYMTLIRPQLLCRGDLRGRNTAHGAATTGRRLRSARPLRVAGAAHLDVNSISHASVSSAAGRPLKTIINIAVNVRVFGASPTKSTIRTISSWPKRELDYSSQMGYEYGRENNLSC